MRESTEFNGLDAYVWQAAVKDLKASLVPSDHRRNNAIATASRFDDIAERRGDHIELRILVDP